MVNRLYIEQLEKEEENAYNFFIMFGVFVSIFFVLLILSFFMGKGEAFLLSLVGFIFTMFGTSVMFTDYRYYSTQYWMNHKRKHKTKFRGKFRGRR